MVIDRALLTQYRDHGPMVVVHGKCPTGADEIADMWCIRAELILGYQVTVERYPADWQRTCDGRCTHARRFKNGKPWCPSAGPLRNQYMVNLGADECLAFPLPGSRGTWDCVRRARAAGIPVVIHGR